MVSTRPCPNWTHSLTSTVYDLSLISGIPSSLSDLLPLEPLPTHLDSLFSAGVHDMAMLSHGSRATKGSYQDPGFGWVACTTDEILSQKPHLYDYVVHIPPPCSDKVERKAWPKILNATGAEIKATQRDLRRYRVLRRELPRTSRAPDGSPQDLSRSLTSLPQDSYETDTSSTLDADLAESQSWSALAYNSFMWWASAGERRSDLEEEAEHDAALLCQLEGGGSPNRPRSSGRSPDMSMGFDTGPHGLEMTIIAYFHRLTALILKTLADIVDDADQSDPLLSDHGENLEEEEEAAADTSAVTDITPLNSQEAQRRRIIVLEAGDMSRMGLDMSSKSDVAFVRELVAFYWDREAEVKVGRIECCGVQIL